MVGNQFNPDYIVAPGETLQELLDHYEMSQAELAERTGKTTKHINEIIKGKAPISYETAFQFESVFGVPAEFWNNLESNYRQMVARKKYEGELQEQIDWLKKLPVKFMIKQGWIKNHKDKTLLLKEVLSFFGVASFNAWQEVWEEVFLHPNAAFRQSQTFPNNAESVAVWLRQGEIEAQKVQCEPYNEKLFKDSLEEIKKFTDEEPEIFMPKLRELCSKAGVAVVLIPETPKSRVSGATTWKGKKPIIILSFRYKTNDHFWFTFFHEAGHILKHSKKSTFLEYNDNKNQIEDEANMFASSTLIHPRKYDSFIRSGLFTEQTIRKFAIENGIAPGCVLGRLQRDGFVEYPTKLNSLKKSYNWT